jgi:hypothetical protein
MVPGGIKIPMPFDYVFPKGALFLAVEPVKDWDAKGADDQARDDAGVRLWAVRVMDLDEDAGKFGRRTDTVVKIAAPVQPVPPTPQHPGYPPAVEFDDLTVTPYVDGKGCHGRTQPHRCRARQAWSIRAAAMREAGSRPAASTVKTAA